MKRGNALVDQVLSNGKIVTDFDTSLSSSEINSIVISKFPDCKLEVIDGYKLLIGEYLNKKYTIRCKNITYLGNPHPAFKKRIQIASDLQQFYDLSLKLSATPILLGVYTYQDNTIFTEFGIETYIDKKKHNSSAHIYSDDISRATRDGFFQKIDYFGNRITAFRPDVVNVVLDELLVSNAPYSSITGVIESLSTDKNTYCSAVMNSTILPKIQSFFLGLDREWNGIECYTEMIMANYRNKYQGEWVGFYLEFKFENYIQKNHLENIMKFSQNKSKDGIDLDIIFPIIDAYGDLKAHSESSSGIQGNDWKTIHDIILGQNEHPNHIYYLVCEHSTRKDTEFGYEVTQFWNTALMKEDRMSYSKRMKHDATLKKFYVLDINPSNWQYISLFRQGINSNGKPREPKILIEHDMLSHFSICEKTLCEDTL